MSTYNFRFNREVIVKRRNKILFILVPLAIIIGIFVIFLFYGKEETLKLVIADVDISKVPDGNYMGSYNKGRFSYKVEVIVKNNKIDSITILDKPSISLEYVPKKMIDRILEKQSLNVDVVTGATATSKAILKAIENAIGK